MEQDSEALSRSQAVPQLPQSESVVSEVSHPLLWMPSQLAYPASQLLTRQLPVAQLSVALVSAQVVPQLPQLVTVVSEVSQPSDTSPLQSAHPASQVRTHVPLEHEGVA